MDRNLSNRWIGRCGPISWPARSPDLTPCDNSLRGYIKEKVQGVPKSTKSKNLYYFKFKLYDTNSYHAGEMHINV